MRPPVLVTPPATLPVTLADAKLHLRVDHADDDTLISTYIEAATAHLDGYSGVLGRALVAQTWRQDFDAFCRVIRLAMPASSVTSITWRNEAGQIATIAAEDYDLQRDHLGSFIRFKNAYSWPSGLYQTEAVAVTYVAGYGAATDVPAAIKAAIMLMVGDLYQNRETVSEKGSGRIEMSTTVDRLLTPYRRVGI